MKNVYFFLLILFLTKSAYAIEFQGKFIQGHFIIGKTDPKTKVWIDKNKVRTSDDGYFVFGIGRDRKYDVVITLNKDGNKQKIVKKVQKRKYNIQRIDGLEEKKVTPPEEVYERIKRENKWIREARAINSNLIFFIISFLNFLFLKNLLIIGVSTKVGQTVFTLILFFAKSIAIPFVKPSSPNFVIL